MFLYKTDSGFFFQIHVVNEERLYMSWATWDLPEAPFMNDKFGITAGKKILNQLHYQLGVTGFSEVHVHVFSVFVVLCNTIGGWLWYWLSIYINNCLVALLWFLRYPLFALGTCSTCIYGERLILAKLSFHLLAEKDWQNYQSITNLVWFVGRCMLISYPMIPLQ